MKRITVRCPLVLNMNSQQFVFKPGQTYEVEDAVAAHPYLQKHLATFIDITPLAKEKPTKEPEPEVKEKSVEAEEKPAPKKNAKKTATVKEAENAVESASDA